MPARSQIFVSLIWESPRVRIPRRQVTYLFATIVAIGCATPSFCWQNNLPPITKAANIVCCRTEESKSLLGPRTNAKSWNLKLSRGQNLKSRNPSSQKVETGNEAWQNRRFHIWRFAKSEFSNMMFSKIRVLWYDVLYRAQVRESDEFYLSKTSYLHYYFLQNVIFRNNYFAKRHIWLTTFCQEAILASLILFWPEFRFEQFVRRVLVSAKEGDGGDCFSCECSHQRHRLNLVQSPYQ